MESEQQVFYGKDAQPFMVIEGLDVNTEYEFATVAVNYHGKSNRSDFNSTYPGNMIPSGK